MKPEYEALEVRLDKRMRELMVEADCAGDSGAVADSIKAASNIDAAFIW